MPSLRAMEATAAGKLSCSPPFMAASCCRTMVVCVQCTVACAATQDVPTSPKFSASSEFVGLPFAAAILAARLRRVCRFPGGATISDYAPSKPVPVHLNAGRLHPNVLF
jgi:hypothetical protein